MDAKKCDACGVFYENYTTKILIRRLFGWSYDYDLCPDCQGKVMDIIFLKEKEEKKKKGSGKK